MDELLKTKRSSLLSALVTQVMTLKLALTIVGSVVLVQAIVVIVMACKKPLVVGLNQNNPEILSAINDDEVSPSQVKAFIYDLLNRKFPPKPTVEKVLPVCRYFTEGLRAACESELKGKNSFIPQEVLVKELLWNEKVETAKLEIKRFATFNGSVSAVDSLISLRIVQRSRTAENPWGLFVDSWKEEVRK